MCWVANRSEAAHNGSGIAFFELPSKMCKVCTEAVHCVALWTRTLSQVWACVSMYPSSALHSTLGQGVVIRARTYMYTHIYMYTLSYRYTFEIDSDSGSARVPWATKHMHNNLLAEVGAYLPTSWKSWKGSWCRNLNEFECIVSLNLCESTMSCSVTLINVIPCGLFSSWKLGPWKVNLDELWE